MDMGIVNPTMLEVYSDINKELLDYVEDVLLNRRPDATERLLDYAETVKGDGKKKEVDLSWRNVPVNDRLSHEKDGHLPVHFSTKDLPLSSSRHL